MSDAIHDGQPSHDHLRAAGPQLVRPAAERSEPDVSELAVHGDPSRQAAGTSPAATSARSTVAWVRPTDLFVSLSGRASSRGIDFQAELARRTRRLPSNAVAVSRRGIARRSHRLAPVTAFGVNTPAAQTSLEPLGLK
ncbi:hypothetical protein AB0870_12270 [Microbacterium proteolyticum]|uniref:Uncharacterized protein n=1 Tax=Compostimonas suwonensis TaxID=1048394 RepID=A0A2M9BBZ9_9MICO|nr:MULTISPECIES: hypothetical protein [Microbacteriaceae]PJJ55470.1 hypothetical protein CLV54_2814 [Compostimonas suwonensis]